MEGVDFDFDLLFAPVKHKSATQKAEFYLTLSIEQRNAFSKLDVNEQIRLLSVPIKKQNKFRKTSVNEYVTKKELNEFEKKKILKKGQTEWEKSVMKGNRFYFSTKNDIYK